MEDTLLGRQAGWQNCPILGRLVLCSILLHLLLVLFFIIATVVIFFFYILVLLVYIRRDHIVSLRGEIRNGRQWKISDIVGCEGRGKKHRTGEKEERYL